MRNFFHRIKIIFWMIWFNIFHKRKAFKKWKDLAGVKHSNITPGSRFLPFDRQLNENEYRNAFYVSDNRLVSSPHEEHERVVPVINPFDKDAFN